MKFSPFDPAGFGLDLNYDKDMGEFIYRTKSQLQAVAGDKKRAIGLESGGADSTAYGKIAYEALDSRFTGIHFEHGFMRERECKEVLWNLNSECKLPVIYRDLTEAFMPRVIDAGTDAEEKRKAISETYFHVALNLAKEFDAEIFIHGTIKPDWLETKAKIKTQHNVIPEHWQRRFEDNDIKIIEPLYHLYKPQVRNILRHYNIPSFITERQPFPGPGLAVRCVGQVNGEKMEILRKADAISRPMLEKCTKEIAKGSDFQSFCAIMDNKTKDVEIDSKYFGNLIKGTPKLTEDKVTGMVEDNRTYTNMLLIDSPTNIPYISSASEKFIKENLDKNMGRVAVLIDEMNKDSEYNIILRSILTDKFTTAQVAHVHKTDLKGIASHMKTWFNASEHSWQIAGIYYDVTPKPPGTIEFE